MTPHDSLPFRGTAFTPFEEELVNAMNDFANAAETPTFDTPGMVRKTRRRRTTVIAGIAAAFIVAGGGTALASMAGGSETGKPAAATTATTKEAATVLYDNRGVTIPIDMSGLDLVLAKQQLLKAELKLGTVSKAACNGKPGSVIAADPHTPKTVSRGDSVNLTLCSG